MSPMFLERHSPVLVSSTGKNTSPFHPSLPLRQLWQAFLCLPIDRLYCIDSLANQTSGARRRIPEVSSGARIRTPLRRRGRGGEP
jgi:hypothetical protein